MTVAVILAAVFGIGVLLFGLYFLGNSISLANALREEIAAHAETKRILAVAETERTHAKMQADELRAIIATRIQVPPQVFFTNEQFTSLCKFMHELQNQTVQ